MELWRLGIYRVGTTEADTIAFPSLLKFRSKRPRGSLVQWSGKTDGYFIISRWISLHDRSKFPTIGWQSDCNLNPPAISRWTKKCPGNVADSSCELLDFSRKKYSHTSRYAGNGNRYPPCHEHGYLSAGRYRGMQVKVSKMNSNLLRGGASILSCSVECSRSLEGCC